MNMVTVKRTILGAALSVLAASAQAGIYFQDGFDGDSLSKDWTIERENPDNYVVESGGLTLLVPDRTSPLYGKAPNTLVLTKPLPKGDWTMTVRLKFTPQTMGEEFRMGVAKDAKNALFSIFWLDTTNYDNTDINLMARKLSHGKKTSFGTTLYKISGRNLEGRGSVFPENIAAVDLQLQKKKHNYISRMRLEPVSPGSDGAPDGKWHEVQKLTSLRSPGNKVFLTFGSYSSDYLPHDGEALIVVDSVTIETP